MIVYSIAELVEEIKAVRIDRVITQKEIAEKANVSQQTISGLENGSFNPSFVLILKLTKLLGLTLILRKNI